MCRFHVACQLELSFLLNDIRWGAVPSGLVFLFISELTYPQFSNFMLIFSHKLYAG